MQSTHELLTRWPALDVTAKRARLQNSLHLSPGALAATLSSAIAPAERAAAALWSGDGSAWTGDAAVQKEIARWMGWMSSPALMAESLDRLTTFAALRSSKANMNGMPDVYSRGSVTRQIRLRQRTKA